MVLRLVCALCMCLIIAKRNQQQPFDSSVDIKLATWKHLSNRFNVCAVCMAWQRRWLKGFLPVPPLHIIWYARCADEDRSWAQARIFLTLVYYTWWWYEVYWQASLFHHCNFWWTFMNYSGNWHTHTQNTHTPTPTHTHTENIEFLDILRFQNTTHHSDIERLYAYFRIVSYVDDALMGNSTIFRNERNLILPCTCTSHVFLYLSYVWI